MNFRVFLLIGAMGLFGALWASDGRYQTRQIEMVRAEQARSANAAIVAKIQREMSNLRAQFAIRLAEAARTTAATPVAVVVEKPAPISEKRDAAIAPDSLIGRLTIAWVFNLDPGHGVNLLAEQATFAKAQLEERFCLLRFRTRQTAFFASRRVAAYLRTQLSAQRSPARVARVISRDVPIEARQAPAANGNQTR